MDMWFRNENASCRILTNVKALPSKANTHVPEHCLLHQSSCRILMCASRDVFSGKQTRFCTMFATSELLPNLHDRDLSQHPERREAHCPTRWTYSQCFNVGLQERSEVGGHVRRESPCPTRSNEEPTRSSSDTTLLHRWHQPLPQESTRSEINISHKLKIKDLCCILDDVRKSANSRFKSVFAVTD